MRSLGVDDGYCDVDGDLARPTDPACATPPSSKPPVPSEPATDRPLWFVPRR